MEVKDIVTYKNQINKAEAHTHHIINDLHVKITGNWRQLKMHDVCQYIQGWNSSYMWLNGNQHKHILREIGHICFNSLILLNLGFNNIESIQGIWRLQMPLIQEISLGSNQIHTLSELKKVHYNKLQFINITNNIFSEGLQYINHIDAQLQQLSFEHLSKSGIANDISLLCKMKSNKLRRIYSMNQKRIKQSRTLQAIQRKYIDIQIYLQ